MVYVYIRAWTTSILSYTLIPIYVAHTSYGPTLPVRVNRPEIYVRAP